MDILYRAQKMGMKIWTLEKLQRVVSTMNDAEIGPSQGPAARHTTTTATTHGRGRAENDLSLALRNDKIHGYWDRDLFRDMVLFKGPFLYIHDMDEKTRPVMVREYPKTAKRQDGPWPQFRSTRIGKCPFVVDETVKEKELEKKSVSKPKPKEQEPTTQKPLAPPQRPNKELIRQDAEGEPESELSDLEDHLSRTNADTVRPASPRKQGQPPKFAPLDLAQMLKQEWSREPAASGVQPSNITSAIRSQMISSTTGIHGVKATTSKEVNELKRKVLEKNNCTVPLGGTSSSHRQAETAAANRPIRAPVPRAAKTKAQGNLGPIREDAGESNTAGTRKSAKVKRDPKPGYCENCREKFDDFEEVSRVLSVCRACPGIALS
jgi:regulatory subunit for Cdc7p protein kinase